MKNKTGVFLSCSPRREEIGFRVFSHVLSVIWFLLESEVLVSSQHKHHED